MVDVVISYRGGDDIIHSTLGEGRIVDGPQSSYGATAEFGRNVMYVNTDDIRPARYVVRTFLFHGPPHTAETVVSELNDAIKLAVRAESRDYVSSVGVYTDHRPRVERR